MTFKTITTGMLMGALLMNGCNSTPSLALSTQEILDAAYLDELKAEATYEQVMVQFGEVKPFSNIIHAEVRHSQAVLNLYENLGLTPPSFDATVPSFSSIQEACAAGVLAEQENITLYDQLMAQTTDPSILATFENLQKASQEKHLPAFERCD